jgi:hypothetical protein
MWLASSRERTSTDNRRKARNQCMCIERNISRRDQRAILAEREISFLNALVVCRFDMNLGHGSSLEIYTLVSRQKNPTRPTSAMSRSTKRRHNGSNSSKHSYNHANEDLRPEIDASGGDSLALGHGRTREALLSEIEEIRREITTWYVVNRTFFPSSFF